MLTNRLSRRAVGAGDGCVASRPVRGHFAFTTNRRTALSARPRRAFLIISLSCVRLMEGTGRVNVAQGAAATAQGVGAALSPLLGGVLAQHFGYPGAFVALGAVSVGSLVLWLSFAVTLRRACGVPAQGASRSSVYESS